MTHMRVQWIETDIKNAFVVGLKLLRFSNQTMFVGKSLRTMLTLEEFDAVISHELSHVANRHIHKRVIELLKNFLSIITGLCFIAIFVFGLSFFYFGDEMTLHLKDTAIVAFFLAGVWIFLNYALFFDTIRSHEFEGDAYAVLKLNTPFESLKSALEKLNQPEEMPEYLQSLRRPSHEKNRFFHWIGKIFSTHPSLPERLDSLTFKISHNLPFDYYFSPAQKIRGYLGRFIQWRVTIPLGGLFTLMIVWTVFTVREGRALVSFINTSTAEKILKDQRVVDRINSKPFLVGKTLMYYIIQKRDNMLIDHFVNNGADKRRTLIYISMMKDFESFQNYFNLFQTDLTEEDYFLILRKTAELNFTQGYRYLVQSSHFESLDPAYKADVTRIHYHSSKNRLPASELPGLNGDE
jgi:hypothetical protein